jgi:hypothetical protein
MSRLSTHRHRRLRIRLGLLRIIGELRPVLGRLRSAGSPIRLIRRRRRVLRDLAIHDICEADIGASVLRPQLAPLGRVHDEDADAESDGQRRRGNADAQRDFDAGCQAALLQGRARRERRRGVRLVDCDGERVGGLDEGEEYEAHGGKHGAVCVCVDVYRGSASERASVKPRPRCSRRFVCVLCLLFRGAIQPRDARDEAESSSFISISRPCLVIRVVCCHLPD